MQYDFVRRIHSERRSAGAAARNQAAAHCHGGEVKRGEVLHDQSSDISSKPRSGEFQTWPDADHELV